MEQGARMKHWLGAAVLALGAAGCAHEGVEQTAGVDAAYVLRPVFDEAGLHAISVALTFQGDEDGETLLRLPSDWGGETELWTALRGLAVDGAEIAIGDAPYLRVLSHEPSAVLTVRYEVIQDWEGTPGVQERNPYRPVIQPDYLHVIGWTALAYPNDADQTATTARLRIADVPAAWSSITDAEHPAADTLAELQASVWVAGDFRVLERDVLDAPLRVAFRGELDFDDEAFFEDLAGIIEANHEFWGDAAEEYLVTVLPLTVEPGRSSMGGTGLGDAFAFFISPDIERDMILRVLAHEHLHTWIPLRVGGLSGDDEALDYWFSEGFTDFYTWRIGVRSGRLDRPAAIEALNRVLERNALSPARNAPNSVINEAFWSDQAVGQLPYDRGMLAALRWDRRIRAETDGRYDIDDVMHALHARWREAGQGADAPSGARQFVDVVRETTGVDLSEDYEATIERGEDPLWPIDLIASCGVFSAPSQPVFARGFEGETTEDGGYRVTAVDEDGPAWPAGLRPGMALDFSRSSGQRGDVSQPYVLQVVDGPAVRYWPHGETLVRVPQLMPDARLTAEDEPACLAALAGE